MGIKEDNLSLYSEYNKTLRAWFVGFGFGVPALFIVNDAAREKLLAFKEAELIIWLFLIGAAAQVLMAFINKVISWCAYYKHEKINKDVKPIVKWIAKLEDYFVIDVLFDVISIIAFCWSILLIVGLYQHKITC